MRGKEKFPERDRTSERLAAIASLPRLSPQQETAKIKVCRGDGRHGLIQFRPELIDHLPPVLSPRIEVTGMAGTGKTTLLSTTVDHLKEHGIAAHLISEREVPFKKDPSSEKRMLRYALAMLHQASDTFLALEDKTKPVLFDRGIYNALAFLEAHRLSLFDQFPQWPNGELSGKEWERAAENKLAAIGHLDFLEGLVFTTERFVDWLYGDDIEAIIICHASPQHSLKHRGEGRVLTAKFLPHLQQAFLTLPGSIARARMDRRAAGGLPLIVELNAEQNWQKYEETFLRAIGSIFYRLSTR